MLNTSKRIISFALAFIFFHQSTIAYAQYTPNNMSIVSVREYFIGRDLGKQLVTVHLLNGVLNPGVYHVPADTDIAELMAYAGGATDRSDLSEITIRRGRSGTYKITELDLVKALKEPADLFRIADQDVIQITQKPSLDRTMAWATIISAIASVALTAVIISRGSNN